MKWDHLIYEEIFQVDQWDDVPESAAVIYPLKTIDLQQPLYIDRALAQLGDQGWELCSALHMGTPNVAYRKVRYFFKRVMQ